MFTTRHQVHFQSAAEPMPIEDDAIELVVTSPPYPMIAMWDKMFAAQDPAIGAALERGAGMEAFEMMHAILDRAWTECCRALRPGGFLCVNIGDATRSVAGNFRLYSNHSRIVRACEAMGFQSLPVILWRKQTNAPNKFMGSGMLPSGAYVTLEHEYILILRKGDKRAFTGTDKDRRSRSAIFWEERNQWFSDVWDFKGIRQEIGDAKTRARSGAFPFELAWRLIHMYSLQEDTVLDPFAGTGTTLAAALAAGRNSILLETEAALENAMSNSARQAPEIARERAGLRLNNHRAFIQEWAARKDKEPKHYNTELDAAVITRQETQLRVPEVTGAMPGDFSVRDFMVRHGWASQKD